MESWLIFAFERREVAELAQAEHLKKLLRRAVEDRPAERIIPSGDPHQAALQ